jgi:hypothetical protein
MYKQINERARISIEQETDNVPKDGKYYVFKDGDIVKSFRTLKQADELYKKLVAEKNLPPLEKQPVNKTTQQLLQQDWDSRSNKELLDWGQKIGKSHHR